MMKKHTGWLHRLGHLTKWHTIIMLITILLFSFLAPRDFARMQEPSLTPTPTSESCPIPQLLPYSSEEEVRLRAETELFDYQLGYVTEWEIAKIRGDGEWGIIELIPIINGQIVPGDGDILLARFQEDEWKIATPKSPEFPDWLQRIPNTLLIPYPERNVFLTPDSPSESTSGLYKLPFSCGVQAKVTRAGSDHDNAIDFLIGAGSGGNDVVVAAQGGWVHRIDQNHTACCCDSSYQANRVILRHPNGEYSYYVHIAANSVVVSLNQWVEQGQAIATEGDVGYSCASLGGGCATRYCEIPDSILDYCCEHLHFEVRDNGHYGGNRLNPRFSDVSGEHVRSEGTYTSGNCGDTDPPTINFTTPDQNQWYNTDQTLSWSITDDDSGVDYYKWAWNTTPPDNQVNSSSGSTRLSVPGQGQHTLYVQAWDNVGNASDVASVGWFGYDTVNPNVPTIHPGCLASHSQWQNTCRDPNFSWAATDPNGSAGSGVGEYAYLWGESNTGDPTAWTADTRYDPSPIADEDDWAQYYLRVKAQDRAGNVSNVSAFGLWYDGVPPTATLAINNGAATAHQTTVQVHLSAGDVGSGVAEVRLSHNGFAWADWQPYADVVAWGIPALNHRDVPVYAQVRDRAGNLSAIVSDTITLDLYPVAPHSTSFRICNDVLNTAGQAGLASTNYSLVSSVGSPWSVEVQPGTMMWLPGATGFLATTACRPISYTVTDDFTLHRWVIASGGNLRSSAGFRLGDTAGQPAASGTNAFSSTSYILSSGFWGNVIASPPICPTPLTDISVTSPVTGIVDTLLNFEVVITPTDATPPVVYTWAPAPETGQGTTKAAYRFDSAGEQTVTITAAHCAGAVTASDTTTVSVLLAPPSGFGVSINDGARYTNDPNVTVRIWAPGDITEMRLSNDGAYSNEGWQTRQVTVPWEIETYGDYVLPRTVYVWFKDAQNQVYGAHTDDIIYDPVSPTGAVSIQSRDGNQVMLALDATDDNSGVAEMRVGEGEDLSGAAWEPFAARATVTLAGDVAYAQFRDHAGNVSRIYASDGSTEQHIYLPLVLRGQ